MKFRKLFALILALAITLSLSSCYISFPIPTPDAGEGQGGEGAGGGGTVEFPDSGETSAPDEWQSSSSKAEERLGVRIFIGTPYDLVTELEIPDAQLLSWISRCETICTVDDGVLLGVAPGRTEIVAEKDGEAVLYFTVTVEFMISVNNGYSIITDKVSDDAVAVYDMNEANRLLDEAVVKHMKSVTMDFSAISESFTYKDFDLNVELGNHVSFRTAYYESTPYIIRFDITYLADTATTFTPLTEANTYYAVESANAAARRAFMLLDTERYSVRADDYNGFATENEELPTLEVYNSEELWWAAEHGYRPVFTMKNSKVRLFYERAKIVLREIILEGMSDYEKALAIYEYVVDSVSYDYDAYHSGAGKSDACYYLEGVFERGRAVCDGKSKAFVLLASMEGLSSVRDYGEALDGGVGHAWNYVEIDGAWYLVDTTEGDAFYGAQSPIGKQLGYGVELVSYETFLVSLDYHREKYVYSGIWVIESADGGVCPAYPTSYFDVDISDGRDFIIDSIGEMNAIFEALSAKNENVMLLVFELGNESAPPFSFVRDAGRWGFDVTLFTISYGEKTVILALLLPEAV